jgi:hypothetical protein
MKIGIGVGITHTRTKGEASFEPEAEALFVRFTTPPTQQRKTQINDYWQYPGIKPIMAKLDGFWMLAAADSQAGRQNWVADQYNLTAVSSPAFAADRGFTGDGSAAYLTPAGLAFNALTNFKRDDASIGFWSLTNLLPDEAKYDAGEATGAAVLLAGRISGTQTCRLNNASGAANASVTNSLGFYGIRRRPSVPGVQSIFKNGVQIGSVATASNAPSSQSMRILCGANLFCTKQGAVAFVGAGLSDAELATLYQATSAYLTSVGALP